MRADRPFVDSPVGDDEGIRALAERVAAELGTPAPRLIRAAMNANFASGDLVIRIGRPTGAPSAAYELAAALTAAGIRVPSGAPGRPVAVGDDGLAATVWGRVGGHGEVDWKWVGEMVFRLHSLALDAVPTEYPVPPADAFPWWRFDAMLERARPALDDEAYRGLAAAVERNAGWQEASGRPTAWVLCHGDVHPGNVVAGPDGPVLLDWDLLCIGPPAWDHGPMLSMEARWGADPSWYDEYAAGYGADLRDDPVTVAVSELRLVAATLMRVLAEGEAPRPDSEARRRLRYWRGDSTAPTWAIV